MALILYIDTTTRNCSVALSEDEVLIAEKEAYDTQSHAKLLQGFIEDLMKMSNRKINDLDAVVVAGGPGSYTGLRIGMSCAKGICYALEIPFIVVDTLKALAGEMIALEKNQDAVYIATLNSRKGEIYYTVIDGKGNTLEPSRPAVVSEIDWIKYGDKKIFIAGNTEEKLASLNANFNMTHVPLQYSAKNYIKIGFNNLILKQLDDLVYMEPNYLKPFR
jgi:tRNA threonylcarbamoyladenosine biosynthesis protein TsaB